MKAEVKITLDGLFDEEFNLILQYAANMGYVETADYPDDEQPGRLVLFPHEEGAADLLSFIRKVRDLKGRYIADRL